MAASYDFEAPDFFTTGTVGQPGRRVFYLQAREKGELVTLKLEKEQVGALAEYLAKLLTDLPKPGPLPSDMALLEPVMRLEITAPEASLGEIVGDLQQRRGIINGTQNRGGDVVIEAEAPLANLFGYSSAVRSLSGGRATATMEPKAYGPSALPIGGGQTISQPFIVARMIELLELKGTEKVLEIGTGTGYQAVVLSRVAGRVFSIERINELALRATELSRLLKISNLSIKVFDGTYGWSDQAPFDRIIVAAAAPEVPQPLLQQMARTGKMVIPLGAEGSQRLARVTRTGTSLQIEDCGPAEFVPLVGRFGWKG